MGMAREILRLRATPVVEAPSPKPWLAPFARPEAEYHDNDLFITKVQPG